jgi:WD40 repeat protein
VRQRPGRRRAAFRTAGRAGALGLALGVVAAAAVGDSVAAQAELGMIAQLSNTRTQRANRATQEQETAQEPLVATAGGGPMTSVAFAPDGRSVASSSLDGNVYLWDASTGERVRVLGGHTDEVYAVAFSFDGRWLASAGYDGQVLLWDASSGRRVRDWRVDPWPLSVVFSPDGRHLLTGGVDGRLRMLPLNGGAVRTLRAEQRSALALAYSPGGDRIAESWSAVIVRDAGTGTVVDTLAGHRFLIFSMAFTPDGTRLVTGSADATIRIWDLATGAAVERIETRLPLPFLAVSSDGRWLAAGGADYKVHLWEMDAPGTEGELIGTHDRDVTGLAFSPDDRRLASSSLDGGVKIWAILP